MKKFVITITEDWEVEAENELYAEQIYRDYGEFIGWDVVEVVEVVSKPCDCQYKFDIAYCDQSCKNGWNDG